MTSAFCIVGLLLSSGDNEKPEKRDELRATMVMDTSFRRDILVFGRVGSFEY
jgi:hypothetical protein